MSISYDKNGEIHHHHNKSSNYHLSQPNNHMNNTRHYSTQLSTSPLGGLGASISSCHRSLSTDNKLAAIKRPTNLPFRINNSSALPTTTHDLSASSILASSSSSPRKNKSKVA